MQPAQIDTKPNHTLLRLRSRRVAGASTATPSELSVICPLEKRPVHVDTCTDCEFCGGLLLGPAGSESFVRCESNNAWMENTGDTESHTPSAPSPQPRGEASRTAVARIMTSSVVTVTVETSVESVTAMMLERGISGIPVVDSKGRAVGMVSQTDLIREQYDSGNTSEVEPMRVKPRQGHAFELGEGYHPDRVARSTVGEIMAPLVLTLPETASVAQAAALMSFEEVHRIPVVRSDGTVAGILSTIDIMGWLAQNEGYRMPATNRAGRTKRRPTA